MTKKVKNIPFGGIVVRVIREVSAGTYKVCFVADGDTPGASAAMDKMRSDLNTKSWGLTLEQAQTFADAVNKEYQNHPDKNL